MKNAIIFFAILIIFSAIGTRWSSAQSETEKNKFAEFFHVPAENLSLECPQRSYTFKDDILEICLLKEDSQKRCEIAIGTLGKAPANNEIDFDVNYADPVARPEWQSVMQIHSFPDAGEKWRCPIAALEIQDNKFRMFNRWDKAAISRVSGYNCAESGSSISSRTVLVDEPVKAGQWQRIELQSVFSPENGKFQLGIDDKKSPLLTGPDSYNDEKPPFIKFGIYKPTSWEPGHVKTCVNYRAVKIITQNNAN